MKVKKYMLDSSAAFYPFISTKKSQSIFSVGSTLKDEVDKPLLLRALNEAIFRFPLYRTRLKKGYGKYFLVENCAPLKLFELPKKILTPIDPKATNGYLFRLCAEGKRVTLEMFHALTDANGAIKFLCAIFRRYRELQGENFPSDCAIPSADETAPEDELQDAFKTNYKKIGLGELNLKGMMGERPHRITGELLSDGYLTYEGRTQTAEIVKRAKALGVSVTAYIVGTLGYSIALSAGERPVVLMIPVNLRGIFKTETMSNFVTFARIKVKRGQYASASECIKSVSAELIEAASEKKMQAFVSTTVRAQKNIIFRAVPLFLKWIFMRLGRLFLKSRQTVIVSNLGRLELPENLGIEDMYFNLNVSKNNVQNMAVLSFGDNSTLTFTSAISELDMPRAFFGALADDGIEIADEIF